MSKKRILTESDARTMFDDLEWIEDIKDDVINCTFSDKYNGLFGNDPWCASWPKQENSDYWRMESRLNVVRKALKQMKVGHDNN